MKNLEKNKIIICALVFSFLFFLVPINAHAQNLDPRFGVNGFVINRYGWQEWDSPVSKINDLGVSISREEFIWELIEPKKGAYNWDFYDRALNTLIASNVEVLGVIDYSAPWATTDPARESADKYMPDITEWRGYVAALVNRYKDRVHYWQIWNEPDIPQFFKPTPNAEQYLELLKNAYEVIKEKDPSAKVVSAGTAGVNIDYLTQLKSLGGGRYFDILAVHPYSLDSIPHFTSPPEIAFPQNMVKAEKIVAEFGNKKIWLTEFGWPTSQTGGVSEEAQANYLSRIYLLSYMYPSVEKLFWYDLRNDGVDGNYQEHGFGIVNRDYSPKKSFMAYKNLINILGGAVFDRSLSNGENGTYNYVFKKNTSEIKVVWSTKDSGSITLEKKPQTKIYDLLGSEITTNYQGGVISIALTDSPIFIFNGSDYADIPFNDPGTYQYEFLEQSPSLTLKPGEKREAWLKIKNTGTATWYKAGNNPVKLGTGSRHGSVSQRSDYASEIASGDWLSSNRPATIDKDSVKPGEVAYFRFTLTSPVSTGMYKAYFTPVVESVTWMSDIGIYWNIEVRDFGIEDGMKNSVDYSYEYVDQTPLGAMTKSEIRQVILRLKNNGKKDWVRGVFNLGTSNKKDRASVFDANWENSNRIMLDQDTVAPGETGSFSFAMTSPSEKGVFKEYFRPVVDGVSWLSDIGIYWQAVVE